MQRIGLNQQGSSPGSAGVAVAVRHFQEYLALEEIGNVGPTRNAVLDHRPFSKRQVAALETRRFPEWCGMEALVLQRRFERLTHNAFGFAGGYLLTTSCANVWQRLVIIASVFCRRNRCLRLLARSRRPLALAIALAFGAGGADAATIAVTSGGDWRFGYLYPAPSNCRHRKPDPDRVPLAASVMATPSAPTTRSFSMTR